MRLWEYNGETHGYSLCLRDDSKRNFIRFVDNHGVELTPEAETWLAMGLIEYELTLGYTYAFIDIPHKDDRMLFKLRWF